MHLQNRIYLTLSPRARKALDLCAALDGGPMATYAATLLSQALQEEIEKSPALQERWVKLEREALQQGTWDFPSLTGREAPAAAPNDQPVERRFFLVGSHPHHYLHGVTLEQNDLTQKSVFLRSTEEAGAGFSTLMLKVSAYPYLGRRVRLSAQVRSQEIEGWAGLWMRLDGPQVDTLDHDNMQNRPIQGTTEWKRYEVVLDVPAECLDIAFGILLQGQGQVWIQQAALEEVDETIAVTSQKALSS
ncbi:hypothetical protein [Tengunoibacter tsumagoiensis]|uniref:Uncharacterized protein n=1 Tax=Tengunoibacter tsumagoiensis TaxID=2014871 RepID=A0A402A085_9CHLR|nr:hypothetical protein [Tengunoibacter tsumagoiensis]GCE12523.1 hypothetical protein KTT_23820 [Tengunoibacter tsumagoiensis]